MADIEKLKKKLQNALKLSGFNLRREFCAVIVDRLLSEGIELDSKETFNNTVQDLCQSFEDQCISEQSIEKGHVIRAIEVCLRSGYDQSETIFNVINATDFPKLNYDQDRKLYSITQSKSKLLSDANSKAKLFLDRYKTVLQRTKRVFAQNIKDGEGLKLQTVDYLLTMSEVTLDRTLILGSLLQVSEGKYALEDPTGTVQLDLKHARYQGGFFVECGFYLVNGCYEDKILVVSTIILPPGEEYYDSRPTFGNINYFGGQSKVPLKDSAPLKEHMRTNKADGIMFFSDVWLDNAVTFEKLEVIFNGFKTDPPIAFVFMGNFMSESHGSELMEDLKKLLRKLANLISKFPSLVNGSHFVFVPGLADPCTPYVVPRLPLPEYITSDFKKIIPKAIFTTNPCRIQYCTREIVVFRCDVCTKLLQGTLHKPSKNEIASCVTRTIVSQGHLAPMPLNALPVHWEFDYCLRLYPLPDLVVIGDRFESFRDEYKQCNVANPGSFCGGEFQFVSYTPFENMVEECDLSN